jgi:hypothetical protein
MRTVRSSNGRPVVGLGPQGPLSDTVCNKRSAVHEAPESILNLAWRRGIPRPRDASAFHPQAAHTSATVRDAHPARDTHAALGAGRSGDKPFPQPHAINIPRK